MAREKKRTVEMKALQTVRKKDGSGHHKRGDTYQATEQEARDDVQREVAERAPDKAAQKAKA